MSQYSHEQVMLTLSLLSYRGFWKAGSNDRSKLAGGIESGLEEIAPLKGNWKLVWGPATYRYLGSIFDSSMMYVVQNRKNPSRFAIVVRGTNPIALSDWLFGDFLSHRQVPWHYGDTSFAPNAQVSLSTALGLKILLGMRSEVDPDQLCKAKKFDFLFDLSSFRKSKTNGAAESTAIFTCKEPEKSRENDQFKRGLSRLTRKLPRYHEIWKVAARAENMTYTLGNFLPADEAVRIFPLRRRLIKLLDATLDAYPGTPVGVLMPDEKEQQDDPDEGIGLLELLGNLAEEHGDKLELFVTGHSKGGALAPVLSLFLSDTQTNRIPVPDHYRWNPGSDAKIKCYAFAGPTPGNSDFASYFNKQLGRNFYRYSNELDMACHAWTSDFRKVATIFGDKIEPIPGTEELLHEVANDMEALDYCHPGQDYRVWSKLRRVTGKHLFSFSGPLSDDMKSYTQQWAYQHVDAYIMALDLGDTVKTAELIGA